MLNSNIVVKNRWKIQAKIGQGAFGETYAGFDVQTGEEVAIKVDKCDTKKMVLKLEMMALKKLQGCPYIVRYIHGGRQDDFNFLVMERLGDNLAELRKRAANANGSFSRFTTLKLGIQMIDAVEGCHNLGYIHRDIKPSNFVIGRGATKNQTYLIDFGLARKYRLPSGEIRPPRKTAGFRGTARYASVNSHQSKELSRRDDLWSIFYVLVEFSLGQLPWRRLKDKEQIGEVKEQHTNADLVKDLSPEFLLFMEHLQKLGYADSPDYEYLRSLLMQVFVREGYKMDMAFDWDLVQNGNDTESKKTSGSLTMNGETPIMTALTLRNTEFDDGGKNSTSENFDRNRSSFGSTAHRQQRQHSLSSGGDGHHNGSSAVVNPDNNNQLEIDNSKVPQPVDPKIPEVPPNSKCCAGCVIL